MKWAIGEIMRWSNPAQFEGIIHIHGKRDRIFPVRNIKNFIAVENAGHLMIVNRAGEITALIERELHKSFADEESN
jgi:hypothetical protein